jgi:tetratricopeptide (TPR) repeat protein
MTASVNGSAAVAPADSASGLDDPRVVRAAQEYLAQAEAGGKPSLSEFVARHPDIAGPLGRCLAGLEFVQAAAPHLSQPLDGVAPPDGGGAVPGTLGDFRIIREVGRGGMGIVYEAVQVSLGRRVALKVLPFAATMDPRQLQRFHNEARAAAGLHHTNIVPVYGVGQERGVHYYAMQFIEGRTLADFIAQQRGEAVALVPTMAEAEAAASATTVPPAAQATSAAPRDAAYFRRAAEWGIQAAEALDCAHALGVVHRDVKPANLLVDAAGRLWVTDFGLAQVQGDARLTLTGDLVGTLRYMSPEQALAQRVVIDHRTDIYSLGATLYELLTLRPAFAGTDRQELLRQIAFEESRPPRRVNKAVPAELETIVLKAMEKNPQDRYATAKELADDLRHWLDDRPIQARRPSVLQRLRKWARRHKGLVRTAAALAMAVLVVGGALLWREQRQRAAAERAVEAALDRADLLQQQERWQEALAVLTLAESQLASRGLDVLRQRVAGRRRDVDMLLRLEEARLQASAVSKEKGFDWAGADRLYAKAFADYGLDLSALGPAEAAARVRTSPIGTRLIVGLDDWAAVRNNLRPGSGASLRALANQADSDPWRRRLREAWANKDRKAAESLAREDTAWSQPLANIVLLARGLRVDHGWAAAERVARRAQQRHPADFWVNLELAQILVEKRPPDPAEATRFCQAALAQRPHSPAVHNSLGSALVAQGKLTEAVAAYRKAIEFGPDFALAHNNLGNAFAKQGKLAAAVTAYRRAIELEPGYAPAHSNLGHALREQGKLVEAVAACRKAIKLKPGYAPAHCNLGHALREQGKLAEAEAACRRAIKLQADLAGAYDGLGLALQAQGKLAEAVAAHRTAIKLQPDDAVVHNNLGVTLYDQAKPAEAEAAFRRAIALDPNDASGHFNLGNALQAQGRLAEAVAAYRKAIALKADLAEASNGLGHALRRQGKLAEAVAAGRRAVKLKPNLADAHTKLGNSLRDQGKWVEAEAAYRKAIALKADLAETHNGLGLALVKQGKVSEAEAAWRRAIELQPDDAVAYNNLGNALHIRGDLAGAIAAWRKSIALKSDYAPPYCNLGDVLAQQGKLAEAEAAFRKGLALKPSRDVPENELAKVHHDLGGVLLRQGKWPAAAVAFQRVIELKPRLAEAHYHLGTALLKQGKLSQAVGAFRNAIDLKSDFAEAHCNLGIALRDAGQFEAALASLRRGHELGSRRPGWPYPSAQWVKDCERLTAPAHFQRGMALVVTTDKYRLASEELRRARELSAGDPNGPDASGLLLRRVQRLAALEPRLPALLKRAAQPVGPEEQLCLAWLWQFRGNSAAAARWYGQAFAALPALAEDPSSGDRYDAACAAALAGCGQSKDAGNLPDKERARLRQQALDWLRADLAVWRKLAEKDPGKARAVVSQILRHWLADPDFAGVREQEALARIPDGERRAWRVLWQEVKALYLRAAPPRAATRPRP